MSPWLPIQPLNVDPASLAVPHVRALTAHWRELIDGLKPSHPHEVRRLLRTSARVGSLSPRFAPFLASAPWGDDIVLTTHRKLTRKQASVIGVGDDGVPVHIGMHHGRYKVHDNHPTRAHGSLDAYCPPREVRGQMQRLFELAAGIPRGLPEVRAAFVLHRFLVIHPFEDGNGRVGRAMLSKCLLEAGLPPMSYDPDERFTRYIPPLRAADAGDLAPLVAYVAHRIERTLLQLLAAFDPVVRTDTPDPLAGALVELRARRQARASVRDATRRALMARLEALSAAARRSLDGASASLTDALGVSVRGGDEPLSRRERRQLLARARALGLHVDPGLPFPATRAWLGPDAALTVAWLPLGRPGVGAGTGVVVLERRDPHLGMVVTDTPQLAPPPPLIVPDEPADAQLPRVITGWLDNALGAAVQAWAR